MFRRLMLALSLGACETSRADDAPSTPSAISVTKTEAEWREALSAKQYTVLREKGTERAYSSDYLRHKRTGTYTCAGCGQALFSSAHKFESGTGWPSFTQPVAPSSLALVQDTALFLVRTEILCSRCGGHLGHVFKDGPPPTGERHCVNGVALNFEASGSVP